MIEYADLAGIVALMIENGDLVYDDSPEEVQGEVEDAEGETEETFNGMNEPTAAVEPQEEEKPLPGQQDMSDYPDYVPEVQEKGLSFTEWIAKKYGMGQYTLIGKEVRAVIASALEANKGNMPCPAEWENKVTNALSVWVSGKTKEYQQYLQS